MHRQSTEEVQGIVHFKQDRNSCLIYYNLPFSRWTRDGSSYHLEFGYTYAFLLLFRARITRQYLWNHHLVTPGERNWSHQLNVKLPDSGSGWGPLPQGEGLTRRGLPPNWNSSAPVSWSQGGFLKTVSLSSVISWATPRNLQKLHLKHILPSNLLKLDRSSLAFNWKL